MKSAGADIVMTMVMGMAVEISTGQEDTQILADIKLHHRVDDE